MNLKNEATVPVAKENASRCNQNAGIKSRMLPVSTVSEMRRGHFKLNSVQLLPLAGIIATLLLWQVLISLHILGKDFTEAFSPASTFSALFRLARNGELWHQAIPSLKRIATGLSIATLGGFFTGIIIGINRSAERFTYTTFQFIRMISPLAWMPIAIILWGIGDKPVFFLIVIAAVWPIVMETHMGVRCVNPLWISVVRTLGGDKWQVLWKVIIPSVFPYVLTGLKMALGISWIILVPAEMLGVSSGLGYYILDCRDRFSYDEMMAIIFVIGFIGLATDSTIGIILARFHRNRAE